MTYKLLMSIVLLFSIKPAASTNPTGCYSSGGSTTPAIVNHSSCRGVLVRTYWKNIETAPGVFDFSAITSQLNLLKAAGKGWSLAVMGGGPGAPNWLFDSLNVPYFDYTFKDTIPYRLPLLWDSTVLDRTALMAKELGKTFNSDTLLKLVYVTQMTANGLEGHLNGFNMTSFKTAGFTREKWISGSEFLAKTFASSFPDKAIAFEVHEIEQSAAICDTILRNLWNDPTLNNRVGAGMWWISGKTSYQNALIQVLKDFPGDIYGQVIGRSDQPERFGDSSYATVFSQAKEIGMRYIEPWNYEYQNHTIDSLLADFNHWSDSVFGNNSTTSEVTTKVNNKVCMNVYPNPLTYNNKVALFLPKPEHVTLQIFSISGSLIKTLANCHLNSGSHVFTWNGHDLSGNKVGGGVYVHKLTIKNRTLTSKSMIVK
jgi:hypothetical protein